MRMVRDSVFTTIIFRAFSMISVSVTLKAAAACIKTYQNGSDISMYIP
jgi:hypothetical protein